MSTTTSSVPVAHPQNRTLRYLALGLLATLLALIGLAAWCYQLARAALPRIDGTIRLRGLSARVTVTRDTHGVPTIQADSLEDLLFAQGYVTAQDRLWQMDIVRRYAAGEMSEIMGPGFLKHDREQRVLGLRAAARHGLETSSAQDRVYLEAYARGVNAFIEADRDHLPLEFRILRYSPRPWTIEDSILMGARMVQDLNHYSYGRALERERILAKLGPELTADLFVNRSWRDRPPSPTPLRIESEPENKRDKKDSARTRSIAEYTSSYQGAYFGSALLGDDESLLVAGSNNWVVSGTHTATGKPLLSNDMHLTHQMPNLWYEAHLRCGDFEVAGVTLPGMPFVIVGHNRRIAWGFTNLGPTVEDVYVESFNDNGQYLTPQGWRTPLRREEVIHVKGAPDVTLEVAVTRHGPIISELIPGEARKLALRWTMYDGLNNPFLALNSAQNWEQFRSALAAWDAPSQNVVYADVDGHIGYQATGHIPIRASGDGSLPVNGSDDAHEWTGYMPFDQLPRVYDPLSGVLATANGRVTADGYPYSLSTEWGSPWRTDRIYRVLESGKKFVPSDMLALQTDIYSAFDRECAERFVYALDHASKLSARAQQARELMRDWDGRLNKESAAATVENRSRYQLMRLLLEPKLGSEPKPPHDDGPEEDAVNWRNYRWFMSSVWLENLLLKQPRRWLPEGYDSFDAVLTAAVESAVSGRDAPADLKQWTWGKFAPVDIEHPIFSRFPIIRRWASPGLKEQSGGGYTVKQVGRNFGPSERMTVDLGDWDRSTLNLVTGETGNFLSPYYLDQWQAWYEGSTFPLPFSTEAVRSTKAHELLLEPTR